MNVIMQEVMKNLKSLNFPTINQSSNLSKKNLSNYVNCILSSDSDVVPSKNSNFHNFLHGYMNNPDELLNQRRL